MEILKKINDLIAKIECIVGSIMLILVVIMVFMSAIMRLVKFPLVWSVDLSQLLFVWICMLGADIALKKKKHMGIDLLVRNFPDAVRKILILISNILCMAFLMFVLYWGINLVITNFMRRYATLQISYSWATIAIPLVTIFMLFTILCQTIELIKNWKMPIIENTSIEVEDF